MHKPKSTGEYVFSCPRNPLQRVLFGVLNDAMSRLVIMVVLMEHGKFSNIPNRAYAGQRNAQDFRYAPGHYAVFNISSPAYERQGLPSPGFGSCLLARLTISTLWF